MTRLIFAAYFLEAGLILILAPWWSNFWDRNGIAGMLPFVSGYLSNHFVRGAVTGIGVITVCAGLVELAGVFGLRRTSPGSDATAPNTATHSEPHPDTER